MKTRKTDQSPSKLPFRQGDLDNLCSVYAVINLLGRRGEIRGQADTQHWFRHLIQAIAVEGNLARFLLEGVDPKDIAWLLGRAGFESVKRHPRPTLEAIRKHRKSRDVIIFLEGKNFTHYTLVDAVDHKNVISLYDSYNCQRIQREGTELVCANGNIQIEIKEAWSVGSVQST